jgi:hypothetical protein
VDSICPDEVLGGFGSIVCKDELALVGSIA